MYFEKNHSDDLCRKRVLFGFSVEMRHSWGSYTLSALALHFLGESRHGTSGAMKHPTSWGVFILLSFFSSFFFGFIVKKYLSILHLHASEALTSWNYMLIKSCSWEAWIGGKRFGALECRGASRVGTDGTTWCRHESQRDGRGKLCSGCFIGHVPLEQRQVDP